MKMRRISAKVHRWVGLAVGLVLAYMALTGASLALKPQLNSKINASLLTTSSRCETRVSIDKVAANATREYPRSGMDSIWIMGNPSSAIIVRFTDEMQGYFDPCGGELIALRPRWSGLFGVAEYLHRFQFFDTRFAQILSGTLASVAIVLTCLGLFTWWPRRGSAWLRSLKVDRNLEGRARFRNRHTIVGFSISPIFLVLTVAGTTIAFDTIRGVLYGLTRSTPIEAPRVVSNVSKAQPAFDSAWKAVLSVVDAPPAVTTIMNPAIGEPIEIHFTLSGSANPKGNSYLFADPDSGKVLKFIPYDQAPAGDRLYTWLVAIHVGLVGGMAGQLLIIATMLGVVYLAYSGICSFIRSTRSLSSRTSDKNHIHVIVKDVSTIAIGVKRLTFSPAISNHNLILEPGAHIDIGLPDGKVRQYSLCNGPEDRNCLIIAVKLAEDGRGGSKAMHNLVVGQEVIASRPRNHFALADPEKRSLLFAAGIGITPILSMARHLTSLKFPFELHYYGRSRNMMAFADDLEKMETSGLIFLHIGESRDQITSSVGAALEGLASDTHVYACGPSGFMDLVGETAVAAGLSTDRFHTEYFQNLNEATTQPKAAFDVELARSGTGFTVMQDESLLAALLNRGIHVERSCEQGTCGSCELAVLSGDLDHRDCVLSNSDRLHGNKIIACVSRCRGKLVLDA